MPKLHNGSLDKHRAILANLVPIIQLIQKWQRDSLGFIIKNQHNPSKNHTHLWMPPTLGHGHIGTNLVFVTFLQTAYKVTT